MRRGRADRVELTYAWLVVGGLTQTAGYAAGCLLQGGGRPWLIPLGVSWAGVVFLLKFGPIPRSFTDKSE